MPLYREWSSDPFSLAAIWEITEPESFFTDRTELSPDIKNEKRRMEHLAGRFLLKHLQHDFPLRHIMPDMHDKPRVPENQYYFSISHSFPYVAAVVSPFVECGIDIQTWHPRMNILQYKFLSASEQKLFQNDPKLITMAWSAKEAAYKWQGRRGVEFIDHLPIHYYFAKKSGINDIIINTQMSIPQRSVLVKCSVDQHFALATVFNPEIIKGI